MVIRIVVGALVTVPKSLQKEVDELEINGRIKTIQKKKKKNFAEID